MEAKLPQANAQSLTKHSTVLEDGSVTQTLELISPNAYMVNHQTFLISGPKYFRTERSCAEGSTIEEMSVYSSGDFAATSKHISPNGDVTLRAHTEEGGHGRGMVEVRQPGATAANRVRISYYPE